MTNVHKVSDFMDKTYTTFSPRTTIVEAIDTLIQKGLIGAMVINDDNELLGILSEQDCLKVIIQESYHDTPSGTVADYYHKSPMVISSDADVISVAEIFAKSSFRRLPVVDNGKVVGQITRRDLLRAFRDKHYNFRY